MKIFFFITLFITIHFATSAQVYEPIPKTIQQRVMQARYHCNTPSGNTRLYLISTKLYNYQEVKAAGCSKTYYSPYPQPFYERVLQLGGFINDFVITESYMNNDDACDAITLFNQIKNNASIPASDKALADNAMALLTTECIKLNGWTNIDGLVRQISIGYAGIICGVTGSDDIFCRTSLTTSWTQLPGKLKQISVSKTDYTICGTAGDQTIWCRENLNSGWVQVPGLLKWISVHSAGNYYGVNGNNQIFRSARQSGLNPTWYGYPGNLKQISIGLNGVACGVNDASQIFCKRPDSESFDLIDGGLSQISVSATDGLICGVNTNSDVWCRNGLSSPWYYVYGKLKYIDVYGGGLSLGLSSYDYIFRR